MVYVHNGSYHVFNGEVAADSFKADTYSESSLPSAGREGRIVWNSDRSIITYDDGDDWEVPVVGNDVKTTTTSVDNTTTETSIWSGSIDGGSMKEGRVYEISLFGHFSNSSTSDNVTVKFYIAGNEVASVASTGKNASEAPWRVKLIFTVFSDGSTGSVQPHTIAKFNQEDADDHHGQEAVDTTAVTVVEAKAQWNNAKAGNTFTRGQGFMKEVS